MTATLSRLEIFLQGERYAHKKSCAPLKIRAGLEKASTLTGLKINQAHIIISPDIDGIAESYTGYFYGESLNPKDRGYSGTVKIWLNSDIFSHPSQVVSRSRLMPSFYTHDAFLYALIHEIGHSVDRRTMDAYTFYKYKCFVPEYGQSKIVEFWAECYAEWYITQGQTTNIASRAMAVEHNWNIP